MKGKLMLLAIGAAGGYVLGTKAGRERYEQIVSTTQKFANDPRVQEKARQAGDAARSTAGQAADKAKEAAPAVKDKVTPGSSDTAGSSAGDPLATDGPVGTPDPGIKGDPLTDPLVDPEAPKGPTG